MSNPNEQDSRFREQAPCTPKPASGPTLLIGLGGTGVNTVDRIRELIREKTASEEDSSLPVLIIDTD